MVSSTRKKSTSEGNHGAQFSPKNVVYTTVKSKLSPKSPSASSPMSQGRKMLRSSESVSTTPTRQSRRVTGDAELDMKSQVQTPAKSSKNSSKDLNNSPAIQTPGRRSRRISTGNALAPLDDVSKATPLKTSKLNVKTLKTPTPTKQQQKLSSEDETTSPANQTSTISLVKKLVSSNETEQNTQTPTRKSRRLSLSVNESTQGTPTRTPTRGRPPKRLSVSNDEAAQSTPTQTKRSKMLSTSDEPTKGTPTRGRPPKRLSVSNVEAAESTQTQTKRSKRLSTSDAEPTKGTPAQNKLSNKLYTLNDEPEPTIGTPAQNKKKATPTTPTPTRQTRRQSTSNNEPNLATPLENKQSEMLSTSKGEQEVATQKATRLSRRLSTSTKDEQEVAIQTPTRRSRRLSISKDEQEVTIQTPTRRSRRLSTSRDDKTDVDQSAGKSLKRSFKDGSKEGSSLVTMPNKRNKTLSEDYSTATLLTPTRQTRGMGKKQDDIDSLQTDRAVKSDSVEDGQVSVEETEEGKVELDCEELANYGENSQVTNTENNMLDISKKVDEVVSADQEERKNGSCRTSSLEVIMEADEIGNAQAEEDSGSKISPEYNEENECEPTEMRKSSVSAYLKEQKIEEVTDESATEENLEIVTEIKPDDSSDVKQCDNDSTEKSEMDKRAEDSKEEISQECNEEQESKEEISQECNEEQESKEEISQECNEEQESKEEISQECNEEQESKEEISQECNEEQENKEEISQECNEEQKSKEEISQECNEEQECQSELSKTEASHEIATESKLNNNNIDSSDGKLYDNNSDKVANSTESKIGEIEDIVSTTVTSAQASNNSLTSSPYLREIDSEPLVGEEQVTSTTDISVSTIDDQENTPLNDIQPQLQVDSNLKIANNKQTLSTTQPMEQERKIRGMPISGRWWKTEKKRSGSIYKDKPFNTSWAKKMQLKQNRKNVMAADAAVKAEKQRRTEELKARRLLNKQRREENARKAEIVQLIKNTSKIKKMKKKHLKYLQKRDTSSM